jgi:Papain family cysteine protease
MRDALNPSRPPGLRWFHVHLVAILAVLLASSWAAAGGFFVAKHLESGGYQPAPINASQLRLGGSGLPASYSLTGYNVRIHDQGVSNSCVSQTLSTMAEYWSKERKLPRSFSGGFVWDATTGGVNRPMSYQEAFSVFTGQGIAPLSVYPYDGQYSHWPAYGQAYPYRAASYWWIASGDRATIMATLHQGYPIGIAIPAYSSFLNWYGTSQTVTSEWGSFQFNHSMTIVGYTPVGVIVQNSWGPRWGNGGRAVLSWSFIAGWAQSLVTARPVGTWPRYVPPKPKPSFPIKRWNATVASYNLHPKRHHALVSAYYRQALSRIAADWWHGELSKHFAGPGDVAHWDSRNRVMYQHFPGKVIVYEWSQIRGAPLKWVRAGKIIRVNR